MSIQRTLYCHMCRGPTLHSVRKKRMIFSQGNQVDKVVYSKICPNHDHIHDFDVTVSINEWKALLKAGKNWRA